MGWGLGIGAGLGLEIGSRLRRCSGWNGSRDGLGGRGGLEAGDGSGIGFKGEGWTVNGAGQTVFGASPNLNGASSSLNGAGTFLWPEPAPQNAILRSPVAQAPHPKSHLRQICRHLHQITKHLRYTLYTLLLHIHRMYTKTAIQVTLRVHTPKDAQRRVEPSQKP